MHSTAPRKLRWLVFLLVALALLFTSQAARADEPVDAQGPAGIDSVNALGAIQGTVFNDLNGNGVQEVGEPPLSGVTVNLFDAATNTLIATTTTDPSGGYSFTNLVPGNYIVDEVNPPGYVDTTPDPQAVLVPT